MHHDKAPAHTSLLVREFSDKSNIITMSQPPYSSVVAPCDFFLFPIIKTTLKEPLSKKNLRLSFYWHIIDDIKSASLKVLKFIPNIKFEKCFEDWKKPWHNCTKSDGDYFEGNNINVDKNYSYLNTPRTYFFLSLMHPSLSVYYISITYFDYIYTSLSVLSE